MHPTDHFAAMYREEAGERLAELEETLLELEGSPDDLELVGKAFRAMHTIKGSAAMFAFDEIAAFTHEMETVFERVRSGALHATPALIRHALGGKDAIRAMLDGRGAETEADRRALVEALRAYSPRSLAPRPVPSKVTPAASPGLPSRTYRIGFRPAADLLQNGTNPLTLIDELRALGSCQVIGHASKVPLLEELDPESCHLSWDMVLTTQRDENAIRDVFIFVEGRCELTIVLVDDSLHSGGGDYKKLGEILVERGQVTEDQLRATLQAQKPIGEMLVDKGVVTPEAVHAAAVEQKVVRDARAKRDGTAQSAEASSIRVTTEKLDALVNLVGELVIAQARLGQIALDRDDAELLNVAEVMERVSASLRDTTLNIRMVPIGTTFSRFKRLVHDLSAELGKDIELVTDGAETELDKTVIDRLGDPLIHLIRNSCDHGIEAPEVRASAGKPARASVQISAYYSGANVFVEIKDDGRGLDAEAIRAKAVAQHLLDPDAKPSEKDLYNLIFLPGFSTAQRVSNLSGRGVGMDVVKRAIESLRGTIEVESAAGRGMTIRLKLPLTLAIIEGLLVAVGDAHYVLPMSLVEECVEITQEDMKRAHGNQFASVRGEIVPYVCLRSWFGVDGARPPIEQIAIANTDGVRVGFVVDHVVGQHQTVIKTLGNVYEDVEGLSGATILGNGTVALILDLPSIARSAAAASARLH